MVQYCKKHLLKISKKNALIIVDYTMHRCIVDYTSSLLQLIMQAEIEMQSCKISIKWRPVWSSGASRLSWTTARNTGWWWLITSPNISQTLPFHLQITMSYTIDTGTTARNTGQGLLVAFCGDMSRFLNQYQQVVFQMRM